MKQTGNFQLNQWDPSDRILREDFNRDNKTIDAALAPLRDLDAALGQGGLGAALGGKLTRMEIINSFPSNGGTTTGGGQNPPVVKWEEWEYVCALYHFPGKTMQDADTVKSTMLDSTTHTDHVFGPFAMPGYMIVFLPRHDAEANVAGFFLADRFVPFSLDFPFSEFSAINYNPSMLGERIPVPNVFWFGGK